MVVLAVTWMAKINREADVAGIFSKLTDESRKEPGCIMYIVHLHKTEPRRFFIYEQYKDRAASELHRTTPHFKKFVVGGLYQLMREREVENLTAVI